MPPRLLAAAVLLGAAAGAHAQAFRTYLASDGVDGPSCSRAAPCRLLPAALDAVVDGGEVWILDSANYNTAPVVVAKSVTILAVPGALGSLVASGGSALFINTPGVKVFLRNLVMVPMPGTGTHGVGMYAEGSLAVQDCTFTNMPAHGVYAAGNVSVRVIDSAFRNNTGDGLSLWNGARATVTGSSFSANGDAGIGIHAVSTPLETRADISDSVFNGNEFAVLARSLGTSAKVSASIRDSHVMDNGTGLASYSYDGGAVHFSAADNLISNTLNHGLDAYQPGSRFWASGNTIANGVGPAIRNGQGIVETAGDNAVNHNGAPANGPVTPVGKL